MFGVSRAELAGIVEELKEQRKAQLSINDTFNRNLDSLFTGLEHVKVRLNGYDKKWDADAELNAEGATWSLDIEERLLKVETLLVSITTLLVEFNKTIADKGD